MSNFCRFFWTYRGVRIKTSSQLLASSCGPRIALVILSVCDFVALSEGFVWPEGAKESPPRGAETVNLTRLPFDAVLSQWGREISVLGPMWSAGVSFDCVCCAFGRGLVARCLVWPLFLSLSLVR